jgi:hypothetical protein
VWQEVVMLARDLIVWTQALLLDGELGKPSRSDPRYRLLHIAAAARSTATKQHSTSKRIWP